MQFLNHSKGPFVRYSNFPNPDTTETNMVIYPSLAIFFKSPP